MQHKFGLHGKLTAKAGQREALAAILLQAAALLQSAKACRLYAVATDDKQPDTVWVSEIWDSADDHAQSLSTPGVRELIGKAMPLLAEMPTRGQELRVLGGVGVSI